jgi:hypothetical protein
VDGPNKYTDLTLLSLQLRGEWVSIKWPRPTVSEIVQHDYRSAGCLINAAWSSTCECRCTAQCVLQHRCFTSRSPYPTQIAAPQFSRQFGCPELELEISSRFLYWWTKRRRQSGEAGRSEMLVAVEISLALWGIIVCAAMEAVQFFYLMP